MTERSITYTDFDIRLIYQERKWQTRRVMSPQPKPGLSLALYTEDGNPNYRDWVLTDNNGDPVDYPVPPHYEIGEKVWIRENWAICSFSASYAAEKKVQVAYKAGVTDINHPNGNTHDLEWRTVDYETWKKYACQKSHSWHTSRHMPRFAARGFQEITDVRAQRLQEISWDDCKDEGIVGFRLPQTGLTYYSWENHPTGYMFDSPVYAFHFLWDKINGKIPGHVWKDNPWVWAYTTKLIKSNLLIAEAKA